MTPTNTPFEESISQILIKLHHDGWEKGKKQVETPYTYTLDDEPKREAFKQITQLHKAAVREAVIKELEQFDQARCICNETDTATCDSYWHHLNPIRDRIAQLKKEEK